MFITRSSEPEMVDLGDLQLCAHDVAVSNQRGSPCRGLVLHVSCCRFSGESLFHLDASILYRMHGALKSRAPRSEYMQIS
jgi:hypothetical protein